MTIVRARQLRKTMSAPEAKLWNALRELRPLGHHFRRQVPIGRYYADFCCHKACLVVEVVGDTHYQIAALAYDAKRDEFFQREDYRILRVTNADVMGNLDGVMTLILNALHQPLPLTPSPQGGGTPDRRLRQHRMHTEARA